MNTLSSVWSKNPPLNEAEDYAAFSDLAECISWFAFKHLAESFPVWLRPIQPRTVWVTGLGLSTAWSGTSVPPKATNVAVNASNCEDVYANEFLNLLVQQINGSGPALVLAVCGHRGAERSLSYEG